MAAQEQVLVGAPMLQEAIITATIAVMMVTLLIRVQFVHLVQGVDGEAMVVV